MREFAAANLLFTLEIWYIDRDWISLYLLCKRVQTKLGVVDAVAAPSSPIRHLNERTRITP